MTTAEDSNQTPMGDFVPSLIDWPIGIWSWEPTSGRAIWNAGMREIFGLSASEIPPQACPLEAFIHPDDDATLRILLKKAASGQPPVSTRLHFRRRDGESIMAEAAVARQSGEAGRYYGTLVDLTRMVMIEQGLRKEKDRSDRAQEIAHFGYWDWDIATGDVAWSDEIHRIFGTTPETFRPHIAAIMARTIPEDRILAKELIDECVAQKRSGTYEQRIRRPDGSLRWFESSFEPVFGPDGTLERILGTAHDITERKCAELSLREERTRSEQAQALARFGYWSWNANDDAMIWSDSIYGITSLPRGAERWDMSKLLDQVYPEDRAAVRQTLACMSDDGGQGRIGLRILAGDGAIRHIESSWECQRNAEGAAVRVLGTLHDITHQKEAEIAALSREEQLRVTLHSIGDGVIATDPDARIVRMNPVAEQLTGFPEEEAIGMPFESVFRVQNAVTGLPNLPPMEHILRGGESGSLEDNTVLCSRDGAERMVADRISPIVNAEGLIEGLVIIFRDITEQLDMEERLRQSQKMESIGLLAGGVAHDFNNMLGGILGAAELLHRRFKDDSKAELLISLIRNAADNAAGLTQKLLAFSRKGKFVSTPIDIHEAISDALAILERSLDRRVRLIRELRAAESIIIGDPSQIQNAILNLAVNADRAMPSGGTLTVSTSNISLDGNASMVGNFTLSSGNYIEVAVADTGEGIPVEIRERIFEPFFTTRKVKEGTGLGLAAVYGTVKDHHGAVIFDSTLGEGTVFRLLFPLEQIMRPEKRSPDEAIVGSGTILIVDDERILRHTAAMILSDLGYVTLMASGGSEAMEIMNARAGQIDGVLLDMIMPEMNGTECFNAIRAMRPDMPIVLCSGFLRTQSVNDLLARGARGFLKKPYHKPELAAAIHQALHSVATPKRPSP